jgi:hypothetical protein
VLFGPVSISREYRPASHALLIDFLRRHCFDTRLANLDDVSQLLEEIEPDGKGAPVLLRQHLKLGGRLACFNVDESFSGVIDGLIVGRPAAHGAEGPAEVHGPRAGGGVYFLSPRTTAHPRRYSRCVVN